MPRIKKYSPNYFTLYPDVNLTDEVLIVLMQSDRKMAYMEYNLKHSRSRKNKDGTPIISMMPREDSFDRLLETDKQFTDTSATPEDIFLKAEDRRELYRCLDLLEPDERALINALFFDNLTQREYAAKIGRTQQSVGERKHRILKKLKKLFKN